MGGALTPSGILHVGMGLLKVAEVLYNYDNTAFKITQTFRDIKHSSPKLRGNYRGMKGVEISC